MKIYCYPYSNLTHIHIPLICLQFSTQQFNNSSLHYFKKSTNNHIMNICRKAVVAGSACLSYGMLIGSPQIHCSDDRITTMSYDDEHPQIIFSGDFGSLFKKMSDSSPVRIKIDKKKFGDDVIIQSLIIDDRYDIIDILIEENPKMKEIVKFYAINSSVESKLAGYALKNSIATYKEIYDGPNVFTFENNMYEVSIKPKNKILLSYHLWLLNWLIS